MDQTNAEAFFAATSMAVAVPTGVKIFNWIATLWGGRLTFFPLHLLGLMGMPRRVYTYASGLGWDSLNLVSTIGGFVIAISTIVFFWNFLASLRGGRIAGNDPWDAWTLEWTTTSPPPAHNFDFVPTVRSRRPLWDLKHPDQPDWGHRH